MMHSSLSDTVTSASAHVVGEDYSPCNRFRPCPKCGRSLERTRRRTVDRLASVFQPVYRYRCNAPSCAWEGNLPSVRLIDTRITI